MFLHSFISYCVFDIHLEPISIWTAHVLLSSHMQLVAIILDSAGLRSSPEERVLGLPCQSQVTSYPLHSLVNFKVALLLLWKTFPNFRITFKHVYPQMENVAPVLCFVCLFVQYFRKFQEYVFPSLFPKEWQGTALSWQFANLQKFDAKEAICGDMSAPHPSSETVHNSL